MNETFGVFFKCEKLIIVPGKIYIILKFVLCFVFCCSALLKFSLAPPNIPRILKMVSYTVVYCTVLYCTVLCLTNNVMVAMIR
jgi:hypothetical protein